MRIKFLFLFLAIGFFACQSEPKEETAQTTETPAAEESAEKAPAASKSLGTIKQLVGSELEMGHGEKITVDAEGAATIFIVRHGETREGSTSLAGPGRNRAGKVGSLFLGKNLSQVYADGNASMQTALAAAKGSEDVPFGIMKMDGTDATAKNLVTNFVDKRVFMAMTLENMEILLNQLSGKSFDIPDSEYDNLFVVTARGLGDADVAHLKY